MIKLMLTSDTHYGMDGKTHSKHSKFWRKVAETIEKEDIKALIWAGDIASFRQRQFRRSLEMAAEHVSIPILLVRGNHDYWNGYDPKEPKMHLKTMEQVMDQHQLWFKQNGIHHLENGPYVIEDVIICGFDGWYGSANPNTNDKKWMPITIYGEKITSQYLVSKAWKDFEKCLEIDTTPYRKSIIVTHHAPYPYDHSYVDTNMYLGLNYGHHTANFRFLQEMKGKFDILCCGHSHKLRDDYDEGIQIYNCGSDYNAPKAMVFEV